MTRIRKTAKPDPADFAAIPIYNIAFNAGERDNPKNEDHFMQQALTSPVSADDHYMAMMLTEAEVDMLDTSISDAAELIRDAGELLDFLAAGLSLGHLDPETQSFHTILRLSRRAFLAAESKELCALDRLESILRRDMVKAIDRKAAEKERAGR